MKETMQAPVAPFSCSYSPNIPELLLQLNCSIAISTYQAGKVVFISPKNENELVQLPRTFNKAMGIALAGNKMAIATRNEVIVLANSTELAKHYPNNPGVYDGLFLPRATYYTGHVDIHDLHFGKEGLWAVNTSFSCLCTIDHDFSFTPRWRPDFITELASEDRCHLNGLAMEDGAPAYISALGKTNEPQGWRNNITSGGVIIHIPSAGVVLQGLPMPHSPRLVGNKLYFLLSATGELAVWDRKSETYDIVKNLNGFVRGMSIHGDYAFIGLSKLRKNSSTFKHLKIADKATTAGLVVMHLPTAAVVGEIKYHSSVDEIYDVQVLSGMLRPGILNTQSEVHQQALSIPGSTFWAQPTPNP